MEETTASNPETKLVSGDYAREWIVLRQKWELLEYEERVKKMTPPERVKELVEISKRSWAMTYYYLQQLVWHLPRPIENEKGELPAEVSQAFVNLSARLQEIELDLSSAESLLKRLEARPSYSEYLKSEHWQETRTAALERAEHRCQLCNSARELNVHHRTYERLGGELPSDLIVLCKECHGKFHDKLPNNRD